jgi:hypothetical protein
MGAPSKLRLGGDFCCNRTIFQKQVVQSEHPVWQLFPVLRAHRVPEGANSRYSSLVVRGRLQAACFFF